VTGVTYQWRRGDADAWTTIPAGDVTQAAGGGAVSWPFAGTGGVFAKLNWNAAKTLNDAEAGDDPLSGPLQVRALFADGSTSSGVTPTFDRRQASAESANVGPGSVNLLTGALTVSGTDVSVDSYGSDLTVARSYNTRRSAETDSAGMFGPGWTSGVLVEAASAEYTQLDVAGSLIQVGLPDGEAIGFSKRNATTFIPERGFEDLKLAYTSSPDSYKLTDADGNATTFTKVTGAPASRYFPTKVTVPGSDQNTTISWEKVTIGGVDRVRPTQLLAPAPTGVSCDSLVQGCRALTFTYATATTATGTNANQWADYVGQVKEISFTAWDPDLATPAMRTIVMARYAYDNSGKLRSVWDPRLDWTDGSGSHHQQDTYAYDADGILTTITPHAQEPWTLTYTTVPGDAGKGRLAKMTRSALTAGTATTTVVYNVPVAGAGAPYDMSATQTARWDQSEAPVRAAAVFPANQIPTGDQAAGTLPSSYERAIVTYLDANAREINTVVPGGYTSASWYDHFGNTVRSITPGNVSRALWSSETDTAAEEAAAAARLSTLNVYSDDGQRLLDAYGPEHTVVLNDYTEVRGRSHTHNVYDEDAPATDNPYNLVTTATESVQYDNNGTPVDAEAVTGKTTYNWTLRQPLTSTVDPDGLNLTTTTTYDTTTGLTTSVTTPAGAGSTTTPSTQKTIYYRAGTGSGYTECDNAKHWANLVCRVEVGGQPGSGAPIPATVTTYDIYNQPRVTTEKTSTATLRTTTVDYDAAGRGVTMTITAPGLGTAVPVTKTVYDQATGEATRTQSLSGSTVTAEVLRGYDSLGRLTSYTDADNVTSTTTYDLLGRLATSNDGKATRTYTYDGGTERRGLLTSVTDSEAGTFTAAYDIDGAISQQTWPNGVAVYHYQDEASQDVAREYHATTGCTTNCALYTEWAGANHHGAMRYTANSLHTSGYVYDPAGRLAYAAQTIAGQCTMNHYAFDDATNRTGKTTYGPVSGDCTDENPTAERTWTYDTASRVTDSGYTYDTLGRTLTVPSTDTTNAGGSVTLTYHADDLVDTITQNGRTTDYTLDVTGGRIRSWTDTATGATAHVNHFEGDQDSPSWTQENSTTYTRPTGGVAGLAAVYDSSTSTLSFQISNIHGDLVATMQAGTPGLTSTSTTDENGQPGGATPASSRYGWLGSNQRAADTPSGLTLMGVRLYNATTGRFLQVDPVYGGSANDYDYCNGDPVNCTDLDGRCPIPGPICWGYNAGSYAAYRYRGSPVIRAHSNATIRRVAGRAPTTFNLRRVKKIPTNTNRRSGGYSGRSWGYQINYTDAYGRTRVYKYGITSGEDPMERARASERQCRNDPRGYRRCRIVKIIRFPHRPAARAWEYLSCLSYVVRYAVKPPGMLASSCR
jgi:RHS repeat-associated protein